MSKFSTVSSWLASIACGVCLVLALLAVPGVAKADPPPPGGGEIAPNCPNPTMNQCTGNVSVGECLANVCWTPDKACNCRWIQLSSTCFCP